MAESKTSENSYRSILKGTTIFGGVQMFQILVNLVRGKFVAILLGPLGMGVSSLYSSAAVTIQQFASLGLNLAIVREVSEARAAGGENFSTIFAVARRLMLFAALLGAVVCAVLSPLLSRWTFGDADSSHVWGFVLLSAMVFFAIIGSGEMSLLQGLHQVKRLSKASLVGSSIGLIVGVPLYYFCGINGIVPALVILSLSTFLFYTWSVRRSLTVDNAEIRWSEHWPLAKKLLGLGLVLMAGTLIGSATNWTVSLFVRYFGSIDDVGLYQSANSITNQYVGMVFSAMSLDFFPRLTAVASDNAKLKDVVNRQTQVVSMIIAPLSIALILTAPLVIRLLLSDSFLSVEPLLRWLGFGVMLRGVIYPMGYIAFAKNNKRLFFWLEAVFGNVMTLTLSCVLYYLFGLNGLGIAIVGVNAVAFIVYYVVNRRMYGYGYDRKTIKSVVGCVALGTMAFGGAMIPNIAGAYIVMSAALLVSIMVSWRSVVSMLKRTQ